MVSIAYTDSIVQPEERRYLRTLQSHIRVEFQLNNDKLNLLLGHGSPPHTQRVPFLRPGGKEPVRIMADEDAYMMCLGHTHKPYHCIKQLHKKETSIAMRSLLARSAVQRW